MNQLRMLVFSMLILSCSLLSGSTGILADFQMTDYIQQQLPQINGRIIDKNNGEPISYCNIALETSTLGTTSNELGEFVVNVDSLPAKLIFSHVNYAPQIVEVTNSDEIVIALVPLVIKLDEVVVSASVKDTFAMKLAKNAIKKIQKPYIKDKYGRAFYRQKSKSGDSYSEFSEIFFDLRYNNVGIKEWNILEGRYALKEGAVHNRNYTSFSQILRPLQPNTDDLIFPIHPSFEVFYNPRIISVLQSDNSKVAIVHFKPKQNLKTPAFDGEVYIDTNTLDILKIKGTLSRDDLELVKLTTKNSNWKNYTISYEIAYKKLKDDIQLDYIKVDQDFDYYKDDSFQYRATSTSSLIFYEHYTPTSNKRLGGRLNSYQSDWRNLDEIGYNESFWSENQIVKRTPVEEELIASFENDNAFRSIFLNSAENIALMNSNISEDPFIKQLRDKTNLYNNYNPIEKVFLHMDKELFSAGETIWYSAYVVLGPFHHFTTASRVLHIDLIDSTGEIVHTQTQELMHGKGWGSIEIPENIGSGKFQLRSYTQWMRNFDHDFFFTKNLTIVNDKDIAGTLTSTDNIDLQFFPEGGYAVAGIAGKVSFKAIGDDGLPRNVKGQLLDSKDKPVAVFNTFDRGAGFFQFTPRQGESYMARLTDGRQFEFPEILANGYALLVNNQNEKSIKVIVQASESLRAGPFYVVGHMRQRKYYQGKFEFGSNRTFAFEIPKTKMPSGVLTLTLFDADGKPWCERPVFINNLEELVITTQINTKKLKKREKITIGINVTDTEGRAVATNLSMAVTDAHQVEKTTSTGTILTHLLLESEIKGYITDPGLLLKDQKRITLQQLDLVMLTHGWRKYLWPVLWAEKPATKEYEFSKGLIISGHAKSLTKKPLPNATLNVVAKSEQLLGMLSTRTALDGSFAISDFNFNGPTGLVFNAFDTKDQPLDVAISLDSNKIKVPVSKFRSPTFKTTEVTETYNSFSVARSKMETIYESRKITELEEVVVSGEKKEKSRNQTPSNYGVSPDATLYTADHPAIQTVLQLIGLFPGVSVNGKLVSIRNMGAPLWVLNGIPVYNDNPSMLSLAIQDQKARQSSGESNAPLLYGIEQAMTPIPVPTFIETMDTYSIERVEVLKGASAAIYGSRGANGVILIYTKKGEGQTYEPVLSPDFTIMGHSNQKEFYSPKYDVKRDEHLSPDYRATLYWNPNIITDANGHAKVEFFNSDAAKEIQVNIEGLSEYGIPGSLLESFGN